MRKPGDHRLVDRRKKGEKEILNTALLYGGRQGKKKEGKEKRGEGALSADQPKFTLNLFGGRTK